MRATIERAALHRAVRLAVAAAGRRRESPSPTLCLIANPAKRTLRLGATGRALDLVQTLPAEVDAGWCRAVAARPLAALVDALPDGPLTLEAIAAGRSAALAIGAGPFRAILPGSELAGLPALPPPGPRCTPLMGATEVASALARVAPAAARESSSRAELTAVCCGIEVDRLVLTATDGFRLARAAVPFPGGERVASPVQLLIPARAVALYHRLLASAHTAWFGIAGSADYHQATLHLAADAGRVICRATPGTPPRYDAAIPQHWAVRIAVDRAQLRRAVRLASRVAGDPSLVLLRGQSSLRLAARDPDGAAALTATLPASREVVAEPVPVAIAPAALAEPLRLCGGRSVTLAWRATNEPVTIRGTHDPDGRECLWVVMPRFDTEAVERALAEHRAARLLRHEEHAVPARCDGLAEEIEHEFQRTA